MAHYFSTVGLVAVAIAAASCGGDDSAPAAMAGSSGSSGAGGSNVSAAGGGNGGSSSGTSGAGGSGGGAAPTIKITSPTTGATVDASNDPDVPVAFVVTNFTLKDPGMCAGAAGCGHVHLLVDGMACNDTGTPYNAAGSASPMNAGLDYCPSIGGSHKITLELHNDDHSAVKDTGGATISDSVTITATGPAVDGGASDAKAE